jgi:hypothetical protein
MLKNGLRLGAVALTSAAVVGVAGSSAWAAVATTPPSLSTVQAKAAAAITLRINDLNAAITKVDSAKYLGAGASTLASYLQSDISPLQTLGQQIAADTTLATAQAATATIFTNFRVLALVLPAAHLAGNSTSIVNGSVPNLTTDLNKLSGHVNPSNAATLNPLIADASSQINAASGAASGVAATVLGYTPADWNGNHSLLSTSHNDVQDALGDVKAARGYLQQIRSDLKSEGASATATSGS